LLVKSQAGFGDDEEGLLGLTRMNDKEYDNLIDQMYKQKKISSRLFSFYMTDDTQ